MRLSCQKVSLLLFASIIACHDPTGPSTISAHFVLQSINGRPLPTYLAATPGPTTTIISSDLTLDKAGNAVIIEHRDEMFHGEQTSTYATNYEIRGFEIQLHPQVCLAIIPDCFEGRAGTVFNGRLNMTINHASDFHIVYEYRAAANP